MTNTSGTGGISAREDTALATQRSGVTSPRDSFRIPLPKGFSRQEYWSGLSCPPPGDLPDPAIKPMNHDTCSGVGTCVPTCTGTPCSLPPLWSPLARPSALGLCMGGSQGLVTGSRDRGAGQSAGMKDTPPALGGGGVDSAVRKSRTFSVATPPVSFR